ncbi:type VII secretion-associated serine protease mycosin [Lentzea tibetensis]|uniref:Type VII secretion-associated serine protease mycosin n=1 Tax=Lentzea tibetensis TaxID=2591470 RepID=A0A563EYX1_9PSEU|nr:type VII secretion-associated serine protease mycosin [Lentzea tibetensis]TWP52920.1 type VII secretion-associated serine protease mycosin [Lentzea tibetensis]
MPVLALALPLLLAGQTIEEQEWHLDALDVYSAHEISRGDGVVVAVIDSGVDASHPDLAGQVLPGTGFGTSTGSDGTKDTDGHGTGMAAIIAGKGTAGGVRGIAPRAKILPVASAEKEQFALDVVADSIHWATDHGARVINMSLGFTSSLTPSLVRAVNYAIEKDVVLVAATGNEGGAVSAPANIGGVIAVAGTNQASEPWKQSNVGSDTVLAAPAEGIVTASPTSVFATGYAEMDGTSAASAIVSGVAALVRGKYPAMSAPDVVNRLITTARDMGEPGRDKPTGFGMVDPVKALTADVPSVARNPLLPPPRASSSVPTTVPAPPVQAAAPVEGRVPFVLGTVLVVGLFSTLLVVVPASRSRRRHAPVAGAPPLPPDSFAPWPVAAVGEDALAAPMTYSAPPAVTAVEPAAEQEPVPAQEPSPESAADQSSQPSGPQASN